MTRCTCTVFARSWKLHRHDCPRYQAHEQREHPITPSQRREGKTERISTIVKKFKREQSAASQHEVKMMLSTTSKHERIKKKLAALRDEDRLYDVVRK